VYLGAATASVQRAMQRQADNRHHFVIQVRVDHAAAAADR